MRNYRKLRAFELADKLAISVYRITTAFPKHEQFGLTSQLRRAAVSGASNIVEGSAKSSNSDYRRFLEIAYGSVCEVAYQLSLAQRLGYFDKIDSSEIMSLAAETARVLNGLIRSQQVSGDRK
ncbi:MAG: four helix bundle protein [Planctomycetota bacterium]